MSAREATTPWEIARLVPDSLPVTQDLVAKAVGKVMAAEFRRGVEAAADVAAKAAREFYHVEGRLAAHEIAQAIRALAPSAGGEGEGE